MSIPHPTTNSMLRGWTGGYSSSASKSMEVTAHFFGPQLQSKLLPQQQQQLSKPSGQHQQPKKPPTHTLAPLSKHDQQQLLQSKQLPNLSTKSTDSTTSTQNTSGSVSPGVSNALQEGSSIWLTPEHASKVPMILQNVLNNNEMDGITNDRSNVQLNSNPFVNVVDPSLQNYQPNCNRIRSPIITMIAAQPSGLESKIRFHEYYISSPPQSASAAFAGSTTAPYQHSTKQRFTGLRILSNQRNKLDSQQKIITSNTITSTNSHSSLQKLPIPNRQSESGLLKSRQLSESETDNAFWQRIDLICNQPQQKQSLRKQPVREPQSESKMQLQLNQEFNSNNTIERRSSAANTPSLVLPQLQGHSSVRHFSQGTSRKNRDTLMDFMAVPNSIEEQYFSNIKDVDSIQQMQQQTISSKQLHKRTSQAFVNSENPVAYMNFSQSKNKKQQQQLIHIAHQSAYSNELAETSYKSPRAIISPMSGVSREFVHRRKYLQEQPMLQRRNTIEQQNQIQLQVIEDEEFGGASSSTVQVMLPQASKNEFEFSFCQSQGQEEDSTEQSQSQRRNSQQIEGAAASINVAQQLNSSNTSKQAPSRMRFNLKSRQQQNLVKKIFHFESSVASTATSTTTHTLAISGSPPSIVRKASTPII